MKRATNADKVEIIKKRSSPAVPKKPVMSMQQAPDCFREGQKVSLIIGEETGMGFKAVINKGLEGILYKNEVFQPLVKGQQVEGFIKKIREDKKIDLCLHKPGYKKVDALSERIFERLKEVGGFIPVTDKSPPEAIIELFGVSKKTYKMIVGRLYKKRLIALEDDGIRLVKERRRAQPPSLKASARQAGIRRRERI